MKSVLYGNGTPPELFESLWILLEESPEVEGLFAVLVDGEEVGPDGIQSQLSESRHDVFE